MFGKPFRLFRVWGIPIQADLSWLFIVVLMTAGASQRVGGGSMGLTVGLLTAVLFMGSILVHELAHALASLQLGIRVRSVTLYMFGGATASEVEERGPKEEFLVAVVGPLSSALLAGVFWGLSGVTAPSTIAWATFKDLAFWNLVLAIFNILPGYPLDGGRVLRAVVWGASGNRRLATTVVSWGGQILGVALIAFGIYSFTSERGFGGFWSLFIGFLILTGARQAVRHDALRDLHVADVMGPPPAAVPAGISLTEALDRFLRAAPEAVFPVVEGERLAGVITLEAAGRVGRDEPLRPVRDAMLPLDGVATVNADARLDAVWQILVEARAALVLRDANLVGFLRLSDVLNRTSPGRTRAA